MEREPRNPASDLARYGFSRFSDPEFLARLPDRLSDGFVGDDRRKLVGLGPASRAGSVKSYGLLRDLGGPVEIDVEQVLAVRGKRLAALKIRHTFTDRDVYLEDIWVIQYDRPVWLTERMVQFDVDDIDAALAELDRLHAQIQVADQPPSST